MTSLKLGIIKLGINGAYGKMGSAVSKLILQQPKQYELTAKISSSSKIEEIAEAFECSDIILDFSNSNGFDALMSEAAGGKARLLIGTTGLSQTQLRKLYEISLIKPVLFAPNTSIGANLIAYLASKTAKILNQYDVEIIEEHHRNKKDAPSGTALMIGKEIAKARNINFDECAVFDRTQQEIRKINDIGFSSIRAGGIYGNHEVMFAGDNEIISISCKALSRRAFAEGALLAAIWLSDKTPNFYSMQDVLDLPKS